MAHTHPERRALLIIVFGSIFLGAAISFFYTQDWRQYESRGAGTNIDPTASNHWAWNNVIGWIDFYPTSANIVVSNSQLSGYASSSVGEISLDCASTSIGNRCGSSDYKVSNDGTGKLSGYAWNDAIGWISFCNNRSHCPGSGISYHVEIDADGDFSGYAWNDIVGWISFSCDNDGSCPVSNYRVKTTWLATSSVGWLESATFDTGVDGGAQINSILWRGNQPTGTAVRFQMAFSNSSSGPWTFQWDDTDTASSSPTVGPNVALPVNYTLGANQQYFRYRIYLYSDLAHTATPRVDDVIVNWSR